MGPEYLDIARKMLGVSYNREIPYHVLKALERAGSLTAAAGGVLRSRQVIAGIIASAEAAVDAAQAYSR